jgi:HK97 family phage prohead protease
MTMLLHKAATFEVKAVDDATGEIEGYGSTFGGEPDSYGDIVAPGAFAATLQEHKAKGSMPKMLWQHDRAQPIGRWTEAVEDDRGLKMRGRLTLAVPEAAKAYALLKDGCIDGLSIGYRIRRHEVDDDTGIWTLTEVDLQEVSVVTIPANEAATVASVKAARAAHEIIEKLRAGDRLTEREFEQLLKGTLGLSNAQAERAARVHLKGPGEPADAAERAKRALLTALQG